MRLFRPTKKSQVMERLYFILFEILLIVLVASIIFNKINDIKTGQTFPKKFLARDLALVKNVEFASPGVLMYIYGKQAEAFSDFEITFDDQYVVFSGTPYPYAVDTGVTFLKKPNIIAGANALALIRSSQEQLITTSGEINPLRLRCGPVIERIPGKITLDPGHGWRERIAKQEREKGASEEEIARFAGDKGIITAIGYESEIMRTLALRVYGHDPKKYAQTRSLKEDSSQSLDDRQQNVEGAVLSLHATTDPKLRAFINVKGEKKAMSEQLACKLLNAITDQFPNIFNGASIIPFDDKRILPEDAKLVLIRDKPGVLLEIGNIDDPNSPLHKERSALAKAIDSAVRELRAMQPRATT